MGGASTEPTVSLKSCWDLTRSLAAQARIMRVSTFEQSLHVFGRYEGSIDGHDHVTWKATHKRQNLAAMSTRKWRRENARLMRQAGMAE